MCKSISVFGAVDVAAVDSASGLLVACREGWMSYADLGIRPQIMPSLPLESLGSPPPPPPHETSSDPTPLASPAVIGERIAASGETLVSIDTAYGVTGVGTAEGLLVVLLGETNNATVCGPSAAEALRIRISDRPICAVKVVRTPLGAVRVVVVDTNFVVACVEPWGLAPLWKRSLAAVSVEVFEHIPDTQVAIKESCLAVPNSFLAQVDVFSFVVSRDEGQICVLLASGKVHAGFRLMGGGVTAVCGITTARGKGGVLLVARGCWVNSVAVGRGQTKLLQAASTLQLPSRVTGIADCRIANKTFLSLASSVVELSLDNGVMSVTREWQCGALAYISALQDGTFLGISHEGKVLRPDDSEI